MRIAIVGAGPAGSAAGRRLATREHPVTLIDRAEFPRDKTCGDWLTPAAMSELALLGLDRDALSMQARAYATVTTTRLVSPDGRASTRQNAAAGACVPRRVLDQLVRKRAIEAGCGAGGRAVRDVALLRSDFDCIVDARGATAGVANAIGLRAYRTVGRASVESDAATRVEIRTDSACRRGYGWIFPVHADNDFVRFNVGVGLWKDDSVAGQSVADYFGRFLAHDRVARAIEASARDRERPVGYPVALGLWRNRVADDGILRIGDAANLADPLTGDGIGNALASGRLVAEAIAMASDLADAAQRWQRQYDAKLGPQLRRAFVLRQLLASTPAKNLAAWLLQRGAPALR